MTEYHPQYIHHQNATLSSAVREVVFGAEDGMVSTLGAITGIATGTGDHFTVVLAGLVIIAVESISMGVGSFLSSKSEREVLERKISEESFEIGAYPEEEKRELTDIYTAQGWPQGLAEQMAETAKKDQKLFLHEMAVHELKIIPGELENPAKNGVYMGISYVFGGAIPLLPYLLFANLTNAIPVSIVITLLGLFIMGAVTTKFTGRNWWKAGIEMVFFASMAAIIGYGIGKLVDSLWGVSVG